MCFIGLFCIFQVYVYEKIETAQIICLYIARPKSGNKHLCCLDMLDIVYIC